LPPVVRILFVGDMHLGKLPSHIPDNSNLSAHDLGPIAAWDQIVNIAIKNKVHAVALVGDLVERTNARFEAYGPLESGLLKLAKAGISAVAVAGNHDTAVLPDLAELMDSLVLLGPNGTWSSHTIHGDDDLAVHLVGWSFPEKHVHDTPLPPVGLPENLSFPVFGLLHGDLGQTTSQYAPISIQDLNRTNYKAWFLGHIHKPGQPNTDGTPFYLGSVTGMHPGETGEHGPVEVCINRQGELQMKRLALAPLRWENLQVECDALNTEDDDPGKLFLNSLTSWANENDEALEHTRAVGFRLTLTGVLDKPDSLRKKLMEDGLQLKNLIAQHSGTVLFVDKISNQTTQRLDLLDIARGSNPESLLARRILVLEKTQGNIPGIKDPKATRLELISQGKEKLQHIDQRPVYGQLENTLESEDVCLLLIRAGRRALEAILEQREADNALR